MTTGHFDKELLICPDCIKSYNNTKRLGKAWGKPKSKQGWVELENQFRVIQITRYNYGDKTDHICECDCCKEMVRLDTLRYVNAFYVSEDN